MHRKGSKSGRAQQGGASTKVASTARMPSQDISGGSASAVSGQGASAVLPDLSRGVIVVLSGGAFDEMNPIEVRDRMDEYIASVNADPNVQAATTGKGLTFKILPGQDSPHLNQTQWRDICNALIALAASPLILVGHSNGGAAAVDLARCIESQGKTVDLLFTCDSVLTLDDNGDVNEVPTNVKLNLNSYVIPTPAWLLAPFPFGTTNQRADGSLDGILNIGLEYDLPGALAHRNAFYDLAGGGDPGGPPHPYPFLILDATLAVLFGKSIDDVITAAVNSLQMLANGANVVVHVKSSTIDQELDPQG